MDVRRCLSVMHKADALAVKLYEEAEDITDASLRTRAEDYESLLAGSADVIRQLTSALRVAAVLVLEQHSRQETDCGPTA